MNTKNKAIVCILISAFGFSIMNLCVKLSGDLPSIEKSFFRNLVAATIAFILLYRSKAGFSCKKENLPALILRAVLGTIGIFCNFYALSRMVLSDASMLNKLSPFFTLIFSYIFLKEKLSPFQCIAIVIAFIGSLFIIKPSFDLTATFPALCGFIGGVCAGGAYTCVRYLGIKGEKGPFIVFFFSAFSCLAALPYMIFFFEPMTLQQFLILIHRLGCKFLQYREQYLMPPGHHGITVLNCHDTCHFLYGDVRIGSGCVVLGILDRRAQIADHAPHQSL